MRLMEKRKSIILIFMDSQKIKQRRKELRKSLTPAEAALWTLLKSKRLSGRKFRRQHSFGVYIVDFYCYSENLVIELDGEVHNDPEVMEYDERRDTYLQSLGLKVFRIENKFVFDHQEQLLKMIEEFFD